MNGYLDLQLAQSLYEDRIRKHREPIVLFRPRKAKRRREAHETLPGIAGALQSAARAVISLLL